MASRFFGAVAAPPPRPGQSGAGKDGATEHGYLLSSILSVAAATGSATVKHCDGRFFLEIEAPLCSAVAFGTSSQADSKDVDSALPLDSVAPQQRNSLPQNAWRQQIAQRQWQQQQQQQLQQRRRKHRSPCTVARDAKRAAKHHREQQQREAPSFPPGLAPQHQPQQRQQQPPLADSVELSFTATEAAADANACREAAATKIASLLRGSLSRKRTRADDVASSRRTPPAPPPPPEPAASAAPLQAPPPPAASSFYAEESDDTRMGDAEQAPPPPTGSYADATKRETSPGAPPKAQRDLFRTPPASPRRSNPTTPEGYEEQGWTMLGAKRGGGGGRRGLNSPSNHILILSIIALALPTTSAAASTAAGASPAPLPLASCPSLRVGPGYPIDLIYLNRSKDVLLAEELATSGSLSSTHANPRHMPVASRPTEATAREPARPSAAVKKAAPSRADAC